MKQTRGMFKRAIGMFAAIAAAMALPGGVSAQREALAAIGPYLSRGHGGKKAHHSSKRFVAMDKRDAAKRRNRAK